MHTEMESQRTIREQLESLREIAGVIERNTDCISEEIEGPTACENRDEPSNQNIMGLLSTLNSTLVRIEQGTASIRKAVGDSPSNSPIEAGRATTITTQ